MSIEQIESEILRLPEEQRREFARWFFDHEAEILGEADEGREDDLSDEEKAVLQGRLKEIEAHPEILVPFDEKDLMQMFDEFAHARAQKTSTRPN